jgi:hypothetical protein
MSCEKFVPVETAIERLPIFHHFLNSKIKTKKKRVYKVLEKTDYKNAVASGEKKNSFRIHLFG